jgi:catechol-2,3-dioxygenase
MKMDCNSITRILPHPEGFGIEVSFDRKENLWELYNLDPGLVRR